MYAGDNNKSILKPFKSGAKIMTGTKTVLTNQARNLNNNIKTVAKNSLRYLKTPEEFEVEIDTDLDNEPDTEVMLHKNDLNPMSILPVDRNKIKTKAQNIIKESMYESPYQMGQHAEMIRNVVNPYNPKRKSKSIVDQKDRFKSKNDIYPKVKVDNSIMDKRVRKVRTYLYKTNGIPVARKIEHEPHQPFNPPT